MPHHVPELQVQAVTAASASPNATTTTTTTTGLLLPYPFSVATQGTQTPQPMCLRRLRVPAALGRFRLRVGGNATLGGHGYGRGWLMLCGQTWRFPGRCFSFSKESFLGSISNDVLEVYSSTVFLSNIWMHLFWWHDGWDWAGTGTTTTELFIIDSTCLMFFGWVYDYLRAKWSLKFCFRG